MLNRKINTKENGFTLIELLVVISIIGILSGVVLTSLNSARSKATTTKAVRELKETATALQMYYNDHGKFPSTLSTGGGYDENMPNYCSWDASADVGQVGDNDKNGDGIKFLDPLVSGGYMSQTPTSPGSDVYYLYTADLFDHEPSGDDCNGQIVSGKKGIMLLVAMNLPIGIPGVTDNDFCDSTTNWNIGASSDYSGENAYCIAIDTNK